MAKRFLPEEILEKFKRLTENNEPIVIAEVGTGITAKFSEAGGADMISVTNTGYYRMDGIISYADIMPIGNANDILMSMAKRIIPKVKELPVCAGISVTDPACLFIPMLEDLRRYGFSAIINAPTAGVFTGSMRANLENGSLGVKKEIEMLSDAKKLGFLTLANIYEAEYAAMAAQADIDILVVNLGVTEEGKQRSSLTDAASKINEIAKAALTVKPDMIVLAHGGPILEAEDTAYIYQNTVAVGFYGGSAIERIPIELPIQQTVEEFKNVSFQGCVR